MSTRNTFTFKKSEFKLTEKEDAFVLERQVDVRAWAKEVRERSDKEISAGNIWFVESLSLGKTWCIDLRTDKMAVAKCHKLDKYNYDIGRAIAYSRLIGAKIPAELFESDAADLDKAKENAIRKKVFQVFDDMCLDHAGIPCSLCPMKVLDTENRLNSPSTCQEMFDYCTILEDSGKKKKISFAELKQICKKFYDSEWTSSKMKAQLVNTGIFNF